MTVALIVPKTVQVGCHVFTIEYDKSKQLTDNGNYGEINYRLQHILLRGDRPASQRCEALIHELFHLVATVYKVDIEEQEISLLAEGMAQALSSLGLSFDWKNLEEKL